ncbi:putative nucleotide-binding alpha-beta plait domain, RBM40, RNA recognition motif 1 [Rosa chinensis]|uniref:Putative nucleotide-binding alpha-beta plait domain, RBM40, RNA recognition motif 1 n=1 Tax=Rosa chinensis TaxID=74649 RepID=A0A2P6QHL4_ROSCH|nr:U11/U12 small nuclear ribonucleoprotein 65 kDa protein isoform X1 [Rosa chinensis]PRQ33672.1 putative nucleotide-binding alpha-beta plait domain, RBM40, RNA recognition motif 1 [Rosa chinensis]
MQQQHQQHHLGFEEPPSSSKASLLIRHLPEAIPEETLFRLLSHYGASSVRSCSPTGRMRNCAFVDFQTEGLAYQAQRQLNGLRFLGKVLKVERATSNSDKPLQDGNKDSVSLPPTSTSSSGYNPTVKRETRETEVSRSEPIAPRLGVDYCFPPHLEYAYPPPDGNILTNIVNALIAVPRFYTQVLHLMNKMNIPAPFRMALPSPPLPPAAPVPFPPPPPPLDAKPPSADISSDESEMESSDEEASRGASRGKKRVKRESILGPAVDKGVAHEDVGLKQAILVPKEMPMIKKKNPLLQITIAQKVANNEHKDDSTTKVEELPETESSVINPFATPEELERGKLPPEEILSLPMFKNYTAGTPAPVLYIKNLAKDIVGDDFYYIFGSLFGSIDAAKSALSVKLMQEGRMRGQAFITFPSVEQSQYALNLVNGYVFKGKPMIIQFGRNPAAVKAT